MTRQRSRSVCPYDCPDTCGLLVEHQDDRVVSVKGDPQHPYSGGALCAKVNGYQQTVHSPRRLLTPLFRNGPKGSGRFRPVSWEEALERIAGHWKALLETEGGEAILPCSYAGTLGLIQRNAGHAFFHRLGASRLERTLCSPAIDVGWAAVMGQTPGPDPDVATQSDLILLWGINALATNLHFLRRVKQARRRGARVWLIDTYRTPTAALADRLFLVRPGSDGALALGMLHLLEREGRLDREFLRTQVLGFEELSREVLPHFALPRVTGLTGLSEEELSELTRGYGQAVAPFIRLGNGLSRYGNGAMTVRCITCLPAAVGAWAKPGGGLLGCIDTGKAFDLDRFKGETLMARPTRRVNINQLGHALTTLDQPRVRSLYVYHCNPAAVVPDQNAVLAGLGREDLFTVVHERFLTDTARFADVVLPATTMLEHPDLYLSYGHYCAQRARRVVPPVGQSKPNWETFQLLARAMGFQEPLSSCTADELIDELVAAPSPWREGIAPDAFAHGQAVRLTVPSQGWETPSGKIELLNFRSPHPLPDYLPTHEETAGRYPLRLMTAPALHGLNSSFGEREELVARKGPMSLKLSAADAATRGLTHAERVIAFNDLGEVEFLLEVTPDVPPGVAVAEGVYWLEQASGPRTVNALTSQRLTDEAGGSTFYDNRIEVRRAGHRPEGD
jgi:anaerobic selenocysteine-containing dehydrogenase